MSRAAGVVSRSAGLKHAVQALAAAALASCGAIDDRPVAPEPVELFSSPVCAGFTEPQASWIADDAHWRETFESVASARADRSSPPVVDFSRAGVLLVAMGLRSTGGYDIALSTTPVRIEDGVLTVRVDWREPAPEAIVTQALTSPCILIQLPAASHARIEVIDQEGRIRAATISR